MCFSHLRWNFVRQRPQHLLTRAAKRFDVLFIEEPVFEAGGTARLKREGVGPSLEVLVPIVDPADTQSLAQVLHGLVARELDGSRHRTRVFWYYTPAALAFTQTLHRDLTIYDNMDELSAFRGASDALVSQERTLLATADLVFTGGYSLYAAKRDAHPDIHCFPSSVETAHFARARQGTTPDPAD
ncbi:hypothetical protein [Methylobacterium sp. Leaf87]|uniref:hypothetical protein n=1 Tax=Methylobacterium sp. Leaf87 TaxID=1736243 RepID=UPI000B1406D6|nr:hypothetical protein [Methylobacterium sp. Leaf87]